MEAASVPVKTLGATPVVTAVRTFIGRFGLIILLAAGPVYFAVHDLLQPSHSLVKLGNVLVAGISNGAIWALVAVGYTLVYGIIELINFAHGDLFMLCSFVSFGFFGTIGLTLATGPLGVVLGLLITMLLAMAVCGTLNVMIERVAYRPLRNAPKLAPLITAVGFSFILQNVGILWLGGSQQSVPDLWGDCCCECGKDSPPQHARRQNSTRTEAVGEPSAHGLK